MIRSLTEKIKNVRPSASINSAALIIAVAGILSRLLGLFRDRLLAAQFGAGDTLDIYYAAFRIPDLIYNLLILGALSAAFIPVLTGLLAHEKKEEAWKLTNSLVVLAIGILAVLCAIFAIFTPQIMRLITPGFSGEKIQEVIMLTRIMFLSPILLGLSGIFGGVLNSLKRFLIYSLAPVFYNFGIIVGVIFFYPMLGISGLAWGVVFGALLHLLVQYPAVRLNGYRFTLDFNFQDHNLKKIMRLMIPRTMSLAVTQINLLVITILASTLASGSLTIFNFANNLQSFPIGIFAIPFALAVFPTLSHFAARDEKSEFIASLSQTFRQILFFIIPATIFTLVLRAQIVRIILGSGRFNWDDTILTFQALGIFAISLFAQCLIPLLARAFFALHNTKTPFVAGIVSEVFNFVLAVMLAYRFGVLGLVWAFSISNIVEVVILLFILRSKLGKIDDRNIVRTTIKISLAAVAAGATAQLTKYAMNPFVNLDTFLGVFTQATASALLGIGIYLLFSHYFQLPELAAVRKMISFKSFRQQSALPEDPTEASGI